MEVEQTYPPTTDRGEVSKENELGEGHFFKGFAELQGENGTEKRTSRESVKKVENKKQAKYLRENSQSPRDYEEIGLWAIFLLLEEIQGGRKPALSFMRPFGCLVTILYTLDHLGKFDGKADEGFFIGYSTNSKAYRVFNSRTRIVEENMHVKFSKETPNIAGNGPNWLFDIDALTMSMKYKRTLFAGNQTNGNAGTKENIDASQDGKKIDYPDAGFKPSGEEEKMGSEHPENEDSKVPNTEEPRINQEQDANVNGTNNINIVSLTVNAADIENNATDKNIVYGCIDDPNMPNLEDIVAKSQELYSKQGQVMQPKT
ncbi:ribonuclease H-like domain-containing protein [Tanacetum coccineum]